MTNKHPKFWSLTLNKLDVERYHALHDSMKPEFRSAAFFADLLDTYVQAHCPECGNKMTYRRCPCKDGEAL